MLLTVCPFISLFRRVFRIRDIFLILLILAQFCFGGGFLYPNSFEPGGKVREVYTKSQSADSVNDENGNFSNGWAAFNENKITNSNGTEGAVTDIGGLPKGEDSDPIARERQNKIREMTLHAWNNYKTFAWGKNELRPLSKSGHNGVFGHHELGATIVDSLDTLYIMGLKEQYEEGRDWVARKFSFKNLSTELSVFETNIRFVGGFLTMYALTGEQIFKEKAIEVADRLLPAFETRTGVPKSLVNIGTGHSRHYHWSTSSILSEFGTLHLEFAYLSNITGNPIYRERVTTIRKLLKRVRPSNGLYSNYLNTDSGTWDRNHVSLGGLGDSFYEYLLKSWLQSGRTDTEARQMYDDAMEAIVNNMIRTSPSGLTYVANMINNRLDRRMEHLACFAGGLFALGASTKNDSNSVRYMIIGMNITKTCHESYIRTATHLGPEVFRFGDGAEAQTFHPDEKHYILRPEAVESYFVLWRLTHDQKYRDWAWDVAQAIERYCWTPNGYSGIHNVYSENPVKDDVQQSFYIAEVLKYLYLIFSNDSLLPLNDWVFNTEAHPLPVKGHPMYRSA